VELLAECAHTRVVNY